MDAIFIGGCNRSGTTMLGSMLGASKTCFTTPESQFKNILSNEKLNAEQILTFINNNFRFKLWGIGPLQNNQIQEKKDIFKYILASYKKQKKIDPNKQIWIDHTPDNFENFSLLIEYFPNAKFIHLIRDSRGVAASVMPLDWGPNDAFQASDYWSKKIAFGLAAEVFFPEKVVHVKFEDIVNNPEQTIKNLCHKLNIVYHPEMIKGDKSFLPNYTLKQHALVGNMPSANKIDSWKQKLTAEEIKIIEGSTRQLLMLFGYNVGYVEYKITLLKKMTMGISKVYKRIYSKTMIKIRQKKSI